MATKQSANYDLTLQDNDEFIEIETTAENFKKLDEIIKGLEDEIDGNTEKITNLSNNGYAHPTYPTRASGLYKITVDSSGHVSGAEKVTKSDITNLGIPSVNTVYTHPAYTSRTSGLYKITVDGSGHVSGVTAVTKADITALGIKNYGLATENSTGLLSATDKAKLDKIEAEANKTIVDDAETIERFESIEGIKKSTNPISTRMAIALAEKNNPGEVLFEGEMGDSVFPDTYGDPTNNTVKNIDKYKIVLVTIDDTDIIGTITKDSGVYGILASVEIIVDSSSSTENTLWLYSAMVQTDTTGKVKTAVARKREAKSSTVSTAPKKLTKIIGLF